MPSRNQRSRPRAPADAPARTSQPPRARQHRDHEAVDGVLVQIKKTDLNITDAHSGQMEKRPGYEIKVAIPEWQMNRGLLKSVRKGYGAYQQLLTRMLGDGAPRHLIAQRFVAIDKAVAESLSTVAQRIRTRRWRERDRGEAFQRLQDTFEKLEFWTAKATRYCDQAQQRPDSADNETVLDAACLAVLKVGELVNKVELMQHGFWVDYSAETFLDVRRMRNLVAHTDDLSGGEVIPVGTGIIRDLQAAIARTLFPDNAGRDDGGFTISAEAFRALEPLHPDEKPTPDNSIAMIRIDENNRFVVNRVGRNPDDKPVFASSVTGRTKLTVQYIVAESEVSSGGPD